MSTTIQPIESVSELTVCRIVKGLEREKQESDTFVKKVSQDKPLWIRLSTK